MPNTNLTRPCCAISRKFLSHTERVGDEVKDKSRWGEWNMEIRFSAMPDTNVTMLCRFEVFSHSERIGDDSKDKSIWGEWGMEI